VNLQTEEKTNISEASEFAETIISAQAAMIANEGDLRKAEALLLPFMSKGSVSANTIDLLAKVCVQQDKFKEAKNLWMRALQLDPDNHDYKKAISYCNVLIRIVSLILLLRNTTHKMYRRLLAAILYLLNNIYLSLKELAFSFADAFDILIGKKNI
jgi:tetratricopeptide (TPR) repeat protein